MDLEALASGWALFRLAKFASLFLLVGGMAAVLLSPRQVQRLVAAYGVVLPGFVGTWLAGYGLMKWTDRGFDAWIVVALVASLASLHLVLLGAHVRSPRRITGSLAVGTFGLALCEMVLRPGFVGGHLILVLVAALVTAATLVLRPVRDPEPSAAVPEVSRQALLWLCRVEGISLLALLALSIGRRALGIDVGLVAPMLGWLHGVLVLAWLQALVAGGRALGWSWLAMGSAVVTLLPFGSLAWELWGPLAGRQKASGS